MHAAPRRRTLSAALGLVVWAGCAGPRDPVDAQGGVEVVAPDGTHVPVRWGPLTTSVDADALAFDLFDDAGHRVWLEISDAQVQRMNDAQMGVGGGGDIYTPGGDGGEAPGPFVDHFVVLDGASGAVADFGRVEVRLVGQSTYRPLTSTQIPNFRVDADAFQDGLRIGGFEHFRFNNALIGTMFRERVAHEIYRALGYPALRASYAFVGTPVWGASTWVPMVVMEVYKPRFCVDNRDLLGGDCVNMWEFAGDLAWTTVDSSMCQQASCDDTRLLAFAAALQTTPQGEGFKVALEPYLDWDAFHRFQCINWFLWAGDDPIHNSNNNMIVERDDGRLVWLPYSVDITAGPSTIGYYDIPLTGTMSVAAGCQADPLCWQDTLATCQELMVAFDALDPERFVDEAAEVLRGHGMMRAGDEGYYEEVRAWYVARQEALHTEIALYLPCPDDTERCPDGTCQADPATCGLPEHACPRPTTWCESSQACIDPSWQVCVPCPEDAPRYCPIDGSCVIDEASCAALCPAEAPWCAQYAACVAPEVCVP
jgi:hypothetical protein